MSPEELRVSVELRMIQELLGRHDHRGRARWEYHEILSWAGMVRESYARRQRLNKAACSIMRPSLVDVPSVDGRRIASRRVQGAGSAVTPFNVPPFNVPPFNVTPFKC